MIAFPLLLISTQASTPFGDLLKALGIEAAKQEQVGQPANPADPAVSPVPGTPATGTVAGNGIGSADASTSAESCKDPVTQSMMNHCAGLEYQQADAALNAEWKLALARADASDDWARKHGDAGGSRDKILTAQRAWIFYRDAHCDAVAHVYRGGSIQPLILSSCKRELTMNRTEQLKSLGEV